MEINATEIFILQIKVKECSPSALFGALADYSSDLLDMSIKRMEPIDEAYRMALTWKCHGGIGLAG